MSLDAENLWTVKRPTREQLLLRNLILTYWHGGIGQQQAAWFLEMRKETFAELASGYLFLLILENAAWRRYLAAFNEAFPECDERTVRPPPLARHLYSFGYHDLEPESGTGDGSDPVELEAGSSLPSASRPASAGHLFDRAA